MPGFTEATSARGSRLFWDASILLASSLDIRETLDQLAHAIVPRFADWTTITIAEDDGVTRRVAGVHGDPARAAAMDEYLSSFPPENHRPTEMLRATASGQSIYRREIPDDLLAGFAQDHPGIAYQVEIGTTDGILAAIARGDADIGLVYNPPAHPDVRGIVTARQPLLAILPKNHPLADGSAPVPLRSFATEPSMASPVTTTTSGFSAFTRSTTRLRNRRSNVSPM